MPPKTWFNIAYNQELDENQIEIYDQIGYFGISASQFITDLKALDNSKALKLRINSPGGDVFDGMAIYNILNDYKGEVTVVIDGVAASIASVIAMTGDKVLMHDTAMMMIHKPWTLSVGNSDDLRSDANVLDKIQEPIKKAYQSQTEMDDKELDDIINGKNEETPGTTWLSADKALELGFITDVIKQDKKSKRSNSIEKKIAAITSHDLFAQFQAMPNRIAACIRPLNVIVPPTVDTVPVENKTVTETINPKQKESQMTPEEIEKARLESVAKAQAEERTRQSEIRASAKTLNISDAVLEDCIEKGMSFADSAKVFFAEHAKAQAAVPPVDNSKIIVGKDESDKLRNATTASFLAVSNLIKDNGKKIEALSNGAPKSIHALARTILSRKGVKGVDTMEGSDLIQHVMNVDQGSGDFSSVLADTTNKAIAAGMERANVTYPSWTKDKSVKSFDQASIVKLSSFSDIENIAEGMEPKHGSFSDKKEVGALATGGKRYTISRQALINDNLGMFTEIPMKMGIGLEKAVERGCIDVLYGSSGVGPVMTEDSLRLFDATATTGHGNYVSSGAAPSNTTLDAGILAMRTRPELKGNPKDTTNPTGIRPKFLIVPPGLEATAAILTDSMTYPVATMPSGMPNPYGKTGRNPLTLIVPDYLSTKDVNGWYLAADPMEIDTLVRLTLNGQTAPTIIKEQNRAGEALGLTYVIIFDWAWMVGDWRGLYLNDGESQ